MRKVWIALAILSVLLIISVACNVLLFRQGGSYYRQLNATALDPLGIEAYPQDMLGEQPAATAQRLVVFFGDSRAAEWPPPASVRGFVCVNRGVYGQTTIQALGRFDAHVAPLRPDVVVIQAGINDLKTLPLFPERRVAIIADCQANIREIVARSVALGTTVVVTTIFPLGPVPLERRLFWSDDVGVAIEEVNAFIRTLSAEKVIVLDAAAILSGEDRQARREFSRDLLHLEPAAYQALNRELEPILEQMAASRP